MNCRGIQLEDVNYHDNCLRQNMRCTLFFAIERQVDDQVWVVVDCLVMQIEEEAVDE